MAKGNRPSGTTLTERSTHRQITSFLNTIPYTLPDSAYVRYTGKNGDFDVRVQYMDTAAKTDRLGRVYDGITDAAFIKLNVKDGKVSTLHGEDAQWFADNHPNAKVVYASTVNGDQKYFTSAKQAGDDLVKRVSRAGKIGLEAAYSTEFDAPAGVKLLKQNIASLSRARSAAKVEARKTYEKRLAAYEAVRKKWG